MGAGSRSVAGLMYALAWAVLLLPALGGLASFIAETPRRAGHVCIGFTTVALAVALVLLGYRLGHYRTSAAPDVSLLAFVGLNPTDPTLFAVNLNLEVGVRVDNLSA